MICSDCNQRISKGDKTASGPDGIIHYKCFKNSTANGKEISLFSLSKEISFLKKRIQDLERTVEMHDNNIDFRIG